MIRMVAKRRHLKKRELLQYEKEGDCLKVQGEKYWASIKYDSYGYVIIIHRKDRKDTIVEKIVSGNNMFDQSPDSILPYSHPDAIPEDALLEMSEEQAEDLLKEWDEEVV